MNTKTKQELETGLTLYAMNKEAMKNQTCLNEKQLKHKINTIVKKYFEDGQHYFMLLCHDKRDYTIFNLKTIAPMKEALEAFKDCLINRGEVVAIDKDDDGYALEIWLKIDGEAFAYYFFNYDAAVIEC